MEKKVTKRGLVLQHLQTHGSITTWQACQYYNATRLSAIIFDLRKMGYNIESEKWYAKDLNGNTMTYCVYIYHGKS